MTNVKKIAMGVVIGAALIGTFWLVNPSKAQHCDQRVNIVACGTKTHAELINTYKSSSEIQAVYSHYGITASMVNGANMQEGIVDGNNDTVTVNGRVVATNSKTIQRNTHRPGAAEGKVAIAGRSYYTFSTGKSFIDPQQKRFKAFVWTDASGKFVAAIIKACGNPVWATPTPPPAKPSLSCDLLQAATVSRNSFKFTTKATAQNGATIKSYNYNFGDGTSANGVGATVDHTYTKPGTYTVTVAVNGVEGAAVQKTSESCKVTVTVEPEPTDQVCDLKTGAIVTIKKNEFDEKKYSRKLEDCKNIRVCEVSSGKIVTISKSKYTQEKSKYSENEEDCKVEVCRISDKSKVRIYREQANNSDYTTDMSKCQDATPPAAPSELPRTGASDVILSALGLGSLTAAGVAYVISRRRA